MKSTSNIYQISSKEYMMSTILGKVEVGWGNPVAIIYVLNLSQDSFHKDSIARSEDEALKKSLNAIEEGASIIDVGAMGTGPTSKPISAGQEIRRLVPVIKSLSREVDAPISVDTQRASVAEAAIGAGAEIVNDISGLKSDSKMSEVIASAGCSAILMATDRKPGDVYEIGEICKALRASLDLCREGGISLNKVVVDPAIGHWPARLEKLSKATDMLGFTPATFFDLSILARLEKLKVLKRPICVGISRKTFIGKVLDLPLPADRLFGSLAATAVAVMNGADVIRTHDVKETLQAVRVAEAVRKVKKGWQTK